MQTQITASNRTIIATGKNSNFPKLSDSSASQRFVDLKVKGFAAGAVAAINSRPLVGVVS